MLWTATIPKGSQRECPPGNGSRAMKPRRASRTVVESHGAARPREDEPMSEHVSLRAMTQVEYVTWRAAAVEGYAEALATSTGRDVAELRDRAAVEYSQYLPDGLESAGHWLLTVLDEDGVAVGNLWLGPDRRDADGVFVFDIEITADARGRGFGRGAMLAAEEFAAAKGRTSIGLN